MNEIDVRPVSNTDGKRLRDMTPEERQQFTEAAPQLAVLAEAAVALEVDLEALAEARKSTETASRWVERAARRGKPIMAAGEVEVRSRYLGFRINNYLMGVGSGSLVAAGTVVHQALSQVLPPTAAPRKILPSER